MPAAEFISEPRESEDSAAQQFLAPPALPGAPRLALPDGTCDSHIHVFGDAARYPLAPERHYTPAVCSADWYWQTAKRLGIDRAVLVQPSVYAFDNRALVDTLRGNDANFRGVAVVGPDIDDASLDRMAAAGVRGVRANLVNANGLTANDALKLAPRLRKRGWHLQLQIAIDEFADLADFLSRAGLPVVIDHFGLPVSNDPDRPAFRQLLELLARDKCWVKLSAHYRFADTNVTPLARALAKCNPSRLLWATDWPHPGLGGLPMPDDAHTVELLDDWLPDTGMRQQVLVDNPTRLYWE